MNIKNLTSHFVLPTHRGTINNYSDTKGVIKEFIIWNVEYKGVYRTVMNDKQIRRFLDTTSVHLSVPYRQKTERVKLFKLSNSGFDRRIKRIVALNKAILEQNETVLKELTLSLDHEHQETQPAL